MIDRRTFLGALGAPVAGGAGADLGFGALGPRAASIAADLAAYPGSPADVAKDEDFWTRVQGAFGADRSMVNFNNGGVSPAPTAVIEALRRHEDVAYSAPAYQMWRLQEPKKETVRRHLARTFGCDTEEIAITRNASESLQICQFGLDLQPGDEVVTTTQDYPRMISTFRQRERREGIVMRQVQIPTPCEDPARVVAAYESAITERTKMLLVCHMINLTGQILPVKEVVALGRRHGIPTIVDGAHAFAHFAFQQADLDCDYYASSLHKWLFAPLGTGLLYVRRSKIEGLWPLMAAEETLDSDIRKFEQIGTHNVPLVLSIADALNFHDALGAERKEARLVYLRDRWARRLATNDRVRMNTSLKAGFACGIANVGIEGIDTAKLQQHLWRKYRIYTIGIVHDEFDGLRVSPSVYSTTGEIDRFAEVLEDVLKSGLPA